MEKKIRINIVLPLIGVAVAWVALVVSTYLDLSVNQYYQNMPLIEVKASTYVTLGGLVAGSLLAMWAFKRADAAHAKEVSSGLVRAEYRFTGLMIILGMVFLAVFAIGTFMSSFNTSSFSNQTPTVMGRILGVYLPIVLAAAAVVFVLLQSTIYRKTAPIEGSEDKGLSETQKALAIGYAVPIIGTAAAIIMGLIVYDSQGQKLPSWSWVAIQLMIGSSIYFGTRAAARARSAKPVVRAPRVTGAAGAVTLNYVLSLIFAGTVSIMSFTFAGDAVSKLVIFSNCADGDACKPTVAAAQPQWWVNEMLPAVLLLLLVEITVYLVITSRNKEVTA
jgi:hypothetical protein